MDLLWINNAQYLGDYRLLLTFNTGEQKVFDGAEYVHSHPLFVPLQNLANYKNFNLDGWTVSWQDSTLDLAPEFLYENGK